MGLGLSSGNGGVGLSGGGGGSGIVTTTKTASSSAFLSFTGLTSGSYEWEGFLLVPATDSVVFRMEVSTDDGSSWKTSSYNSHLFTLFGASSTVNVRSLTGINLVNNVGTATGENCAFKISASGLSNTVVYKKFFGMGSSVSSSTEDEGNMVSGGWLGSTAINAVRFLFSSGNIASGEIVQRKF